MCIDVWRRLPCGHSFYQNTFQCDHSSNEDGAVFTDGTADHLTHNYEDELYHCKPSPTELRRRRLSSLSLLSGSAQSAGGSLKSPCRLTRAIRPVQERDCAECIGIWQECQWRQSPHGQGQYERHTSRRDYFENEEAAAGHNGLMFTGEGRLGSISPGSPSGDAQHWDGQESPGRRRGGNRDRSVAATRHLENAFFMIAQRQTN